MENILQNYDQFSSLKDFQTIDASDAQAVEAFKDDHFLTDDQMEMMFCVQLLSDRRIQDYLSAYNDIRDWLRRQKEGAKQVPTIDWDDVVFEVDLLKSQEINLEFILELIFDYNKKQQEKTAIIEEIRKTIRASVGNRSKESLIVEFVNDTDLDSIEDKSGIIESFFKYAKAKQQEEAEKIIADENLINEAARRFISLSLRREYVSENGMDFNEILPKMSPLNPKFLSTKRAVFDRLSAFVEKYKGIGGES